MKFLKYVLLLIPLITFNLFPQEENQNPPLRNHSSNSKLNEVVSINLKGNLPSILKKLSQQYKINFVYSDNLLDSKNYSLQFENKPLYLVLDELLGNFGLAYYEFAANKFVITKVKKSSIELGNLCGVIISEIDNEPLPGANISIKELNIGTISDTKGYYILKNIKPGEYDVVISYLGYEPFKQKILISSKTTTEIDVKLKTLSFQIGGIEVVGVTELLPTDVSTKTIITSGEIEHFQASSIKDVLDLVPGISKSDIPGLSKTTQVSIRGDEEDRFSSFGTLIMVDGIPLSNNANMQFERLSGAKYGRTNLGGGIDLRNIPADNVESIEIVTGLPSVRYGDLTAGLINVQTKLGPAPHRFKIKNNPDTREGNLGGGFLIDDYGLNYNFNAAQSERDFRKTGDEYLRLTGQTIFSGNFFDNELNINSKLFFLAVFDEEEPKGDTQKTKNYNRGFNVGLSSWGKYEPADGVSTLEYSAFVNVHRENSMKSKLVQSDKRILPNGDTISSYMGKVETKGVEWSLGGRLEWKRIFYTGDFIHKFSLGTDPQFNVNTGAGVVFDTLLSYYGPDAGRRPFRFDQFPGQFLSSIYIEDKITGNFIFNFSLMAGFRYDMYSPYKINLKGLFGEGDFVESRQGSFFNPRLSLLIYLSENNQLRISAGSTSKSPAMSDLYPPEEVLKWRNPNDSLIEYFRFNLTNPSLKGFRESQYEVAYDQKFGNIIGSTLSFYYKFRMNQPVRSTIPVFTSGFDIYNEPYVYFIDSYGILKNSGNTESKGIEISLRTTRIKPLNMEFQLVGAYNYLKYIYNNSYYEMFPNEKIGQNPNYKVPNAVIDTTIGMFYSSQYEWEDRLQLNYYLRYTLPPLGLWVTLRVEQILFERNQDLDSPPVDYNLLSETEKINYAFFRKIRLKPNKLLFNLNISKSLFTGSEVSFYVNNFFDEPAIYRYEGSPGQFINEIRNPSLTYGLEFSMELDNIFNRE